MFKLFIMVTSLFLLSACSSKEYILLQTSKTPKPNISSHKQSRYDYRILPHDRLKIEIYKNPEEREQLDTMGQLNVSIIKSGILVSSSGYVVLPLIKRVKVAGLTQEQAADLIARRYRKYLPDPTAYVEVLNKRAYILGEVKRPGVLKLDKDTIDLMEAIAFAGDFTDSAVRNQVLIIHKDRYGRMHMRSIDTTNFDTLKFADLTIKPGDIIYVKPNKWKDVELTTEHIKSIVGIPGAILQPVANLKYLTD